MEDRFAAFCAAVCGHVRAVYARDGITAELTGHLTDHAEALEAQGVAPDDAARRAVEAMGDPAELGRALNRCHSPWPWWIARCSLALTVIALILFLFVGLSWADSHGGLTPLLPTQSLAQAQDQLARPSYTLVGTRPVSGSGRVGDYHLRAAGDALVYTDSDGGLMVFFLVSERHLQPWLGALEAPWYALSAVDDLGNRYAWNSTLFFSSDSALFGSWQEAGVVGVDPAAARLTLTLDPGKGSVRFTVQLREEAAP